MKKQGFDAAAYIEVICYFLMSLILFFIVKEEIYLHYVTAKMKGYLYFSSGVFFIWGVIAIPRIRVAKYKKEAGHCLVLVILIVLLLLPNKTLTGVEGIGEYIGASAIGLIEGHSSSTASDSMDTTQQGYSLSGLDTIHKKIEVTDATYFMWITELFSNCTKYEGYEISFEGRIYKNEKMNAKNEFATVRLLMSCCAVDIIPYGPVCEGIDVTRLEENTWVTVEGRITCRQGGKEMEPCIRVLGIRRTAPPKQEYIYE